jgi:hypothetical protein
VHGRAEVLVTANRAVPVLPCVVSPTRLRLTTKWPSAHCGADDDGEVTPVSAG